MVFYEMKKNITDGKITPNEKEIPVL